MRWKVAGLIAAGLLGLAAAQSEAAEEAAPIEPPAPAVERRLEEGGRPPMQLGSDFGLPSPSLTITGYRPIGTIQTQGLRFSPFTVRATAIAGIGYDDNVRLTQTTKISSMLYTLSSSIAVGMEGKNDRYHALYRGSYGRYASSSADNYNDHNLALVAANDWSARLRTLVQYDFLRGHNQRGSITSAPTQQDLWDWNSLRASGSFGRDGAPARVYGSAAFNARRYTTTPAGVVEVRDYDQVEAIGGFSLRLAPKTRGLLEVQRSEITHPNDPTLDSVEMRYYAGLAWEALAKTRGSLKLGYTTKNFSDGSRVDFSDPTYDFSMTWSPRTYSTVDINVRKFLIESPDAASYFTVATLAGATWNHIWTERVRTLAAYTWTRQELQGLNRTENYQNVTLGVSYGLRRWLRVGAEYRHDTRDTTAVGLDFKRNLGIVTLESAL